MSSSRSKIDYLNKYTSDRGPKKAKKRSKHDRNKADDGFRRQDIQLYDADNLTNMDALVSRSVDDPQNNSEEDEEDAPVVVETNETEEFMNNNKHVPRGAWEMQSSVQDATDISGQYGTERSNPKSVPRARMRRRHDSSSDESAPPRKRHDDSDDSNPPARRHEDSPDSKRRPTADRRRHDSESEASDHVPAKTKSRSKQRHDSSESDTNNHRRRKRHDSSSDNSSDDGNRHREGQERMSSGHRSGIQTGQDFSRREKRLQDTKRKTTEEFVQKHGTGETVYRDHASGAAIDAPQQLAKHSDRPGLSAEEQRKLNAGQAQLERAERGQREFAALQEASFARHKDDSELDAMLKSVIHPDDPMAAYAVEKKQKQAGIDTGAANVAVRPVYKGPPAKPNRFGIPPGYRWDARDRGNGFEDKLLAQKYNVQHQKEKDYRYSSADM